LRFIGLTYITYNADDTGTGSGRNPFARFDDEFFDEIGAPAVDVPTASNSYGVELSWQTELIVCLRRLGATPPPPAQRADYLTVAAKTSSTMR